MSRKRENIFNQCDECLDIDIPNIPPFYNIIRYKDIFKLFKENTPLPNELILKIIELSETYSKCTFCKTKLCQFHTERAQKYGKYYRHYDCNMCDQCCWFEVG